MERLRYQSFFKGLYHTQGHKQIELCTHVHSHISKKLEAFHIMENLHEVFSVGKKAKNNHDNLEKYKLGVLPLQLLRLF